MSASNVAQLVTPAKEQLTVVQLVTLVYCFRQNSVFARHNVQQAHLSPKTLAATHAQHVILSATRVKTKQISALLALEINQAE